jgi:hypothetical protein
MNLSSLFTPPKSIYVLFARTMLWLPLTFFLWALNAPILHFPIALAIQVLSWFSVPSWLMDVEQGARTFNFITSLKPPSAEAGFSASARVATEVNGLLYTFGLPLFAALTLAAAQKRWLRALVFGYLFLLPFQWLAVYATGLKQLAFDMGNVVAQQMEFSAFQNTAVAYAYQFSTLIMPPVTALLAWFLTHQETVRRFVRDGLPMKTSQTNPQSKS